ncbi:hypothetical protein N0Y54_34665, partial [Nostoc punctiforme UO1]|uniref:hypothetical protein n=1 Tax=Nostoc punctiforme TaxID=272131 RepID=UPI0030A1C02A
MKATERLYDDLLKLLSQSKTWADMMWKVRGKAGSQAYLDALEQIRVSVRSRGWEIILPLDLTDTL